MTSALPLWCPLCRASAEPGATPFNRSVHRTTPSGVGTPLATPAQTRHARAARQRSRSGELGGKAHLCCELQKAASLHPLHGVSVSGKGFVRTDAGSLAGGLHNSRQAPISPRLAATRVGASHKERPNTRLTEANIDPAQIYSEGFSARLILIAVQYLQNSA